MGIINKLTNYIYDKSISIHIYEGRVNIVNYKEISNFNSNQIIVSHDKGIIKVNGSKLVVSRLLDNELLISGEIKQIELG